MSLSNPAYSLKSLRSSYVGDGSAARQITTGFKCSLVVLTGWASVGASKGALIFSSTASDNVLFANASQVGNGEAMLHASNGFIVGNAVNFFLNEAGVTYEYVAIQSS